MLMAARTTKIRHDEKTRLKIKTTQLKNRLEDHALGKIDLTMSQIKCIEILLRKTLPDLASVEATMEGTVVNYVIGSKPMSEDDWEATYGLESPGGASGSTH